MRKLNKQSCYVIAFPAGQKATSQYFVALVNHLVQQGHRVVAIGDKPHQFEDMRVVHYTWPSKRPTRPRDAVFLLSIIRKYSPDCLIVNFAPVNLGGLVSWLMRVKCRVIWYHTLSTQIDLDSTVSTMLRRVYRWRKRIIYKLATHIVANSEATSEDVKAVYKVRPEKIKVFHLSITDPFKQFNLVEPPTRLNKIICIGRLDYSKGQDVVIRALHLLKDRLPHLCVEFIGDGVFKNELIELAARLGVEDRCRFVGAIGQRETIFQKLSEALVSLVPSRTEAFGLVNVESLAMGTPVIASNVGGISEIIQDGVNGFLFLPDQAEALAQKIEQLVTNPELLEKMRQNARASFLENFDHSAVIPKLGTWLEEITEKAP